MKILYETETGTIIAYGTYIEANEGQSVLEFDGDIDISECRVVSDKLVKMTVEELAERKDKIRERQEIAEATHAKVVEDLTKCQGVFENEGNTAKDRITALVEYFKITGIIK